MPVTMYTSNEEAIRERSSSFCVRGIKFYVKYWVLWQPLKMSIAISIQIPITLPNESRTKTWSFELPLILRLV